jgi:Fur family zinc uptake transcriptional regulator
MPRARYGFPAPDHDHGSCLAGALQRADAAFAAKALRLTEQRRRVLAEIAGSHRAVGAYEVLERLASKGKRLAPISVYRALDALVEAGVVHRLESRNAYFACHAPHAAAAQVVLTCARCGEVAEVAGEGVRHEIDGAAARVDFHVETAIVEVAGVCAHCVRS